MLYLLLWILANLSANVLSKSVEAPISIPRMQCPVGYTLNAAFFFKTIDSNVDIDDRYKEYKDNRENIEALLKAEISSSLSGEKLIDAASLYYGVKYILKKNPSTDPLTNRIILEKNHYGLTRYLNWHLGYISDQELVMDICHSPSYFPNTEGIFRKSVLGKPSIKKVRK